MVSLYHRYVRLLSFHNIIHFHSFVIHSSCLLSLSFSLSLSYMSKRRCEIALNSVRQSGFDDAKKRGWLGDRYAEYPLISEEGNECAKTNVPPTRAAFRSQLLQSEQAHVEEGVRLANAARDEAETTAEVATKTPAALPRLSSAALSKLARKDSASNASLRTHSDASDTGHSVAGWAGIARFDGGHPQERGTCQDHHAHQCSAMDHPYGDGDAGDDDGAAASINSVVVAV
jgi:hypothetical protein